MRAACASGSVAALAAMADLRARNYRTALVVGVELEKTVPGRHRRPASPGRPHGPGTRARTPRSCGRRCSPGWLDTYDRRFGLDDAHLRAIAAINLANARRNPNAQTREWQVPDLAAVGTDGAMNPPVEGRIRRFDSQPDDRWWRRLSFWSTTTSSPNIPAYGRSA